MFAGIELGGTKIIIAAGTNPDDLSDLVRVPTHDPASTLATTIEALKTLEACHGKFDGIGVAAFGPVGVTPGTDTYGHILRTPKPGWSHANLLQPIQDAFPAVPLLLDTDVNGAALGEMTWGGAQGLDTFCYVTVGTGIGVGMVHAGQPVHGLQHPEAGHIRVHHDWPRDPFKGRCPFHGDCLEGLAAGPTVFDRIGVHGEDLPENHEVWDLIGDYLAQLYTNLTMTFSPQRILVGGGVGLHPHVLRTSRDYLYTGLGGYIEALDDRSVLDTYVDRASLGDRAGILGAIVLAKEAAKAGG